ncbi:regulatory protein RecX [Amphritea sp. 1_MG-2023]|uniref:regulatory protein RecX n=1 Tax=Amphritea sp. 1_MG-2023 TaxID=3062670 RepID=UPI0026E1DE69|nr:regulatory protein RecX [Amphritea sp. 1_MG-2023]MDO6562656.1 regulatory protein RecX [Amphritea sp. 1_MG-2023]
MYETQSEAKNAAIGLLARREHSRQELRNKLSARCESIDLEAVLDELSDKGYQSDQRFAESFVRMRVGQGQGLIKIRFELQRKGVDNELILSTFEAADIDWFDLAADLYRRKYLAILAANDYKEKAKRMRFMSQRGFNAAQINFAIESATTNE